MQIQIHLLENIDMNMDISPQIQKKGLKYMLPKRTSPSLKKRPVN